MDIIHHIFQRINIIAPPNRVVAGNHYHGGRASAQAALSLGWTNDIWLFSFCYAGLHHLGAEGYYIRCHNEVSAHTEQSHNTFVNGLYMANLISLTTVS